MFVVPHTNLQEDDFSFVWLSYPLHSDIHGDNESVCPGMLITLHPNHLVRSTRVHRLPRISRKIKTVYVAFLCLRCLKCFGLNVL